MEIMTEKELREINPEDFEGKDIPWDNGTEAYPHKFTGRVLFDYDQGLSILKKTDPEFCLTGYHGPAYKGDSNYLTEKRYHEDLTRSLNMIKDGYYKGPVALSGKNSFGGEAACSFS